MKHLTRITAGILFLHALLLSGASLAATPQARSSDETAENLLSAMKSGDYASAFEMFDATMKAAVPEERLKGVWEAQLKSFGPLRSWTTTQRTQAQGRDIRIATLTFDHGELQSMIAVDPQSQMVSGFVIRPSAPPSPPAPYVQPSKFREVNVTVGNLGGTLTLPTTLDPVPGVVLVHGSGPQDRDESIGPNKVFKDLAEGLASRGIAVLRYDKRTFTYPGKPGDSVSVDYEVTRDAVAALRALRGRPEVDPQRLFVLGHSLGAQLAPEIAKQSDPVASIILLAPPGRPLADIVLAQMRYLGAPKEEIAKMEAQVARLKSGTLGSERIMGVPASYWNDLANRDEIGTARNLGKPILILRGERDYQVSDEDVEAWRKGLRGVPRVEIVTLPGLNHLFLMGKGKPGPAEYETPGHVDAGVIDRLAAFISGSSAIEHSQRSK